MASTSQSLLTPGFFTAAIQSDNENVFEAAFSSDNPRSNAPTQSLNPPHREPNYFSQPNLGLYPPLDFSGRDATAPPKQPGMNLNGWDFGEDKAANHQYLDPSLARSNVSPPLSLSASPELWAFRGYQPPTSLASLRTSNIAADPRMSYGQITPPDENPGVTSNDTNRPPSSPSSDHFVSESPSTHQPKKRKRALTSTSRSQPKAIQAGPKPTQKPSRSRGKKDAPSDEPPEGDEKRSKFLERNRVAASKCRQKKKEWTNNLEAKARELQNDNTQLALMVESLKEEVMYLRTEMLKHTDCSNPNISDYLAREAAAIARGEGPFSPRHLTRKREPAPSEAVRNERRSVSRLSSVLSRTTRGGTTEVDDDSVDGGNAEMNHGS